MNNISNIQELLAIDDINNKEIDNYSLMIKKEQENLDFSDISNKEINNYPVMIKQEQENLDFDINNKEINNFPLTIKQDSENFDFPQYALMETRASSTSLIKSEWDQCEIEYDFKNPFVFDEGKTEDKLKVRSELQEEALKRKDESIMGIPENNLFLTDSDGFKDPTSLQIKAPVQTEIEKGSHIEEGSEIIFDTWKIKPEEIYLQEEHLEPTGTRMNRYSRSYKMLSSVRCKNEDNDFIVQAQLQNNPTLDGSEQSKKNDLSISIQNLQRECLQAQAVLEENFDPNLWNDDCVTEIIGLNNNKGIEALINIDCQYNITERSFQGIVTDDTSKNEYNVNKNSTTTLEVNKHVTITRSVISESETDTVVRENKEYHEIESIADERENNVDPKNKKRKRVKYRLSNSTNWEYNSNKMKRERGWLYMGRKENKFNVPRNNRTMKVRCSCTEKKSKTKNFNECYKINEEERQKIFQKVWSFSWLEKKVYIMGRTISSAINRARNRKVEGQSRRTVSHVFFLDRKQKRVRVCKTMFCNTLSISMRTISEWLKKGLKSPETKKVTTANQCKFRN